jgi:[ribosomal protein S18]-alanine N-acetyltransferase
VSVLLRPLRAGDLPQVLAIEEAMFSDDAWTEQMFAGELAQPGARYYIVAESGAAVVGYAGLAVPGGGQADVLTIAVRPDRQGQGIGTALLADLLGTAEARGCREIFLDVRADNDRAHQLYVRTGFVAVGVRCGYYRPSGTDAIVMRLRLPRPSQPSVAGRT